MTKRVATELDRSVRAARALSKLVYGGAHYRVEVGALIADAQASKQPVNITEIAAALNLPRQAVSNEFHLLEEAGLLRRTDPGSGRKIFYLSEPSTHWDWCQEARASAPEMLDRLPRY
jgi:DNA-binding transcriptional regulator GbsR (MarR family)